MAQSTSYPSPNSAQVGEGPFYASQHHVPTEDVQTSAPQPRRAQPTTGGRDVETDERVQTVRNPQELRHIQIASPQQIAQSGLESAQSYDHNSGDPSSRKRTKVSRACDECRRKKIRCDATSEADDAQCSSCKRSDMLCMFSRTPQKRGPSKGYIKELAERVGALEGIRRPMSQTPGYQYGAYNEHSPQPDQLAYGSRKRTLSMSEGLQGGRYNPETPAPFARQGGAMDAPNTLEGRLNDQMDTTFEWDEDAVDEYYRVIHATHPLLPDSKAQLHLHLAKASGPIREAFLAAIETLVKPASLTPASDPQNVQLSSKAVGLLMTLQFEDHKNRSFIDNLVYLQSTLLMVLTIDMNISTSFQPPVWYSLAYSMSNFLGLRARPSYKHNTDPEINELEKLARRAWILLMTLDRWYAASTLNPVLTPPKGLTLLQQDSALLGDVGYHLARLSLTLGNISDGLLFHSEGAFDSHSESAFDGHSSGALLFQCLNGELARYRESVEHLFGEAPFLHLSFLHVKLLLNRYTLAHQFETDEVVGVALEMVKILTKDRCPTSPLTHHFATLSAAALLENAPKTDTGDIIMRKLQALCYWLEKNSNSMSSSPDNGRPRWNTTIANYITANLQQIQQRLPSNGTPIDRGGLQHLADAAVGKAETMGGEKGTEEGAKGSEGGNVDFTASMTRGYLHLMR